MPVTAPSDKRFKRAHLKPARRQGWLVWRWRAVAAVSMLALTIYTAHRVHTAVLGLHIFEVQRVVVHGTHRLSNGEVLALLDGLRGESIFSVDLDKWRASLLHSSWVADAILRRTLPSTIDITVQERVPLGIGRIGQALYLVDETGGVIDEYGPNYADLDLPIIDGLLSEPEKTRDGARAELARELLDALRLRNMASRVSQIDVSDSRNAVVMLDDDPTAVRLGDQRFVERLQSYVDLVPALHERVANIDYVDMRFDDRVYVKPAQAAPSIKIHRTAGNEPRAKG